MASAAEQLAQSFNFGAISKATELKKRLWFTLGALVIYRLGTYIPVPGIDPDTLEQIFQQHSGGILGVFDMFAGGALGRMTIFALNVVPYITSAIIMQLMTPISPQLAALKKEGEAGRKKLNQYTRYGTVVLASFQSLAIAVGLEGMTGPSGSAVIDPGIFFRVSTVITLTGGTIFLMWLGEQVTQRGVGNGISLIIFSGIVANLPSALANTLELGRTGALSAAFIILLLLMGVAVIAFIVFMERAQRRVSVQYPKRQMGNKMFGGESSHMPLKVNSAGVIRRHPGDLRQLDPADALDRGRLLGHQRARVADLLYRLDGARFAALFGPLYVLHHVLHLLLRGPCGQSGGDGGEPQEARRFRARHSPRQEHGGPPELHPDPPHDGRRALSGVGGAAAGDPDLAVSGSVLFRRHQPADRRNRDHGHCGADPFAPVGSPI
jgi:hypothetical protein